jgi:hypothetical protein
MISLSGAVGKAISAYDPKRTLSKSFAGTSIEFDQIRISNGERFQDQVRDCIGV